MQKHTKVYLTHFDYGETDRILCEACHREAVDIHHIHGRGKGKDVIENLMAVCRKCHTACHGDSKTYLHPDVMQAVHDKNLKK